jgi:hypothetical protein
VKVLFVAASFIILLTYSPGYSQESPPASTPDSTSATDEPTPEECDSSCDFYSLIIFNPCRGETYEGRCIGRLLIWCEDRQVHTASCRRACGWDSTNCFYNCL